MLSLIRAIALQPKKAPTEFPAFAPLSRALIGSVIALGVAGFTAVGAASQPSCACPIEIGTYACHEAIPACAKLDWLFPDCVSLLSPAAGHDDGHH